MKTLAMTAAIGALGMTEWLVATLEPLAVLASLAAVATVAWGITLLVVARRADAEAARRRRDKEFAARNRVAS